MATIVIDELITKLEYSHDEATLKAAEQQVKQLQQTNRAAAESADKLSAEQRKLAEQTDALTRAQIDLSEQIAESTAKTDRLVAEQRELAEEIERAGGATGKQVRRMLELDEELARSRRETKDLREESARLGREKQQLSQESRKVSRAQQDVAKNSRQAASAQRELKDAMRVATERAREEASGMADLAKQIEGVVGGQLAADVIRSIASSVVDLGKEIITTGANLESLRARLKTVEGTAELAGDAFAMIQQFAASTPFEVDKLTEGFTQLRVRGVQPTTATLTALGDLSAAFGQDFTDVTEAIGAAARGELDPIEKFGIAAKVAGDKVTLSFKGQTEVVDKSAVAVTEALVKFGQMNGVAGAMADQTLTTAGMFSNLKDTVSGLLDVIAQMGVLDEVKLLMQELSASMGQDGLARVIADVLVLALRTLRELFTSMPQDALIEFLGLAVNMLSMMVAQIMGAVQEGGGFLGMLFEWLGIIFEVAGAVYGLVQRLDEIKEQLGGVPGPIEILIGALKLLLQLMGWWAEKLVYLLGLLDPVIAKVNDFAGAVGNVLDRLPSLNDIFSMASDAAAGFGLSIGGVNDQLGQTEGLAESALAALRKFAQESDYAKKTDAELTELIRQGDKGAEAERRKRMDARETAEKKEEAAEAAQKKRDKTLERAERLLDNPGRLTREQLESLATEPFTGSDQKKAEKLRDKAQKELDKRDNKAVKDGKKAADKLSKSLLTAEIDKELDKLAMDAGKRAAARAIRRSRGTLSEEEINDIELAERKRVKGNLARRYEETGQLPPGLEMDLIQTAALPNIEQVGGRLSPPVITVNNTRNEFTITGNTFEAIVQVEGGINGTPQQVATAIGSQAMPVTYQGLGDMIIMQLTNER